MKTTTTPSNFLLFSTALGAMFKDTDCVVETGTTTDIYGKGTVVKCMYVFTPYGHLRINEYGKTQVEIATIVSYGIVKGFGTHIFTVLSGLQDVFAKNGVVLTLRLSATPDFQYSLDYAPLSVRSKSWFVNLPKGKQTPNTPITKLTNFYSKFGFTKSGKLTRTGAGLPSQDMVRTPKPQQIFSDNQFDTFKKFFV
jgi:hypothetical protein